MPKAAIALHEMAELVPRISHCDWLGGLGHAPAREHLDPSGPGKPAWIEAKIERQPSIHADQSRRPHRCWRDSSVEPVRQPDIGILKREMKRHGPGIGSQGIPDIVTAIR
jgi:hypothetical protein